MIDLCPVCETDPCDCETLYTFATDKDALVEQARRTELDDVDSFLVALDRLDRWLGRPNREDDDDA
jgi:hypothetical protein